MARYGTADNVGRLLRVRIDGNASRQDQYYRNLRYTPFHFQDRHRYPPGAVLEPLCRQPHNGWFQSLIAGRKPHSGFRYFPSYRAY
jgi:hypothetical protein